MKGCANRKRENSFTPESVVRPDLQIFLLGYLFGKISLGFGIFTLTFSGVIIYTNNVVQSFAPRIFFFQMIWITTIF